jgi:hypothetical protein
MDVNYFLTREQVSLHNASITASGPARIAHQGLASAYGKLLLQEGFPHRGLSVGGYTFRIDRLNDNEAGSVTK